MAVTGVLTKPVAGYLALAALAVAAMAAALALRSDGYPVAAPSTTDQSSTQRMYACADIGLETQAIGQSPSEAMTAFLREQGLDPTGWEQRDRTESVSVFRPATSAARAGLSLASVTALRRPEGTWQVAGGCVSEGWAVAVDAEPARP